MILHIDMDAFYASVEERENPSLKGKPLVVAGSSDGRGVVSAANYCARQFGVFSAMPTRIAIRKCPHLTIIPPRGSFYSSVSKQIHEIFERYTPVIEPLSLDEAFLDPSGSEKLHGCAVEIGRKIKFDIAHELDLIASVGAAPNKFLAKLASDHDKPDGFTVILPEDVQPFLDALPIEKLWGVGKSAQARLQRLAIRTVKDLRQQEKALLEDLFGKSGEHLWELAHGIDHREVVTDSEVKSISQETTFAQDICEYDAIETELIKLAEGVGFRLRRAQLLGKTITVKVRYHDFKTITRSHTLTEATDVTSQIWSIAQILLNKAITKSAFRIRLVGVGVSGFAHQQGQSQMDLFNLDKTAKQKQLDRLSDEIQNRYGKSSLRRGKSIAGSSH